MDHTPWNNANQAQHILPFASPSQANHNMQQQVSTPSAMPSKHAVHPATGLCQILLCLLASHLAM
jgi:hypothetical protein